MKYQYLDLTPEQWSVVIDKAGSCPQPDLPMFILRCWANSQSVSSGNICAFREELLGVDEGRKKAALRIGNITDYVRDATGQDEGSCYIWNDVAGTWDVGSVNARNLRKAFGLE